MHLRSLRWPDDRAALQTLDTSFTTERVYHVVADGLTFGLRASPIGPPLHKAYPLAADLDDFPLCTQVVVAEVDAVVAGVAALKLETWNRRAVLWHLYIAPTHRGQGIGHALINAMIDAAQAHDARCLWLETQNSNYGAIQFYQRVGFRWCGLDMSLYDPHDVTPGETALFFVRDLT